MAKKINPNLLKIVKILSDGNFHDGSSLGDELGMSRTAVWKMIQKLTQYGIKIDSVKGRGYALLEPLILLEDKEIKPYLTHEKIALSLYESLGSTNDMLNFPRPGKAVNICIAEKQTAGRGRLGRTWHSPFGRNIYLSCLYPFQKDISELAGLSLVVSLALVKTLHEFGLTHELHVKWPNDVLYQGKKIAGNLIEIRAETNATSQAVIGIGVNVNMTRDENAITQTWTSLLCALNKYIDRNLFSVALINDLIGYLQQFTYTGFNSFRKEWIKTDCLTHHKIVLKNLGQKVEGKVLGVNEQGHLLMQLNNGKVAIFSSGEASILRP